LDSAHEGWDLDGSKLAVVVEDRHVGVLLGEVAEVGPPEEGGGREGGREGGGRVGFHAASRGDKRREGVGE